ncbi:MAG: outer membrane beta-barrel protein [Gemmatimonadota bacterium]
MRRSLFAASLLTLGLALAAKPAAAQVFIGAGITSPSSDFGDGYKTGWIVNAGFRPWMSENKRASVWLEGIYGANKAKGGVDATADVYGAFGSVTYSLTADAAANPYVIGSVGYMKSKVKVGGTSYTGDGALGFGGGLGLTFSKKFYVEGRYLTASKNGGTTAFLMLTAGVVL